MEKQITKHTMTIDGWWFIDDDKYIVSPQKRDGYIIEKEFPLKSIMTYSYDEMYILKRE